MNITDIIKSVNLNIGDSSTDRLSLDDRYLAITEATAWLLEELGNEHMTDRVNIEYVPTILWYKVDNLTPYLLTAGNLRFREEEGNRVDFQRVEPRDLASMPSNRYAYSIERYNGDSYLGITMPEGSSQDYQNILSMNNQDENTYVGVNADTIIKEKDYIRFNMVTSGVTTTGLTVNGITSDLSKYENTGVLVFEIEIPDISDVTSVSVKFGSNLLTDYYLGIVNKDAGGNALVSGINIIKIRMSDVTKVGSPNIANLPRWGFNINHTVDKEAINDIRISDLRVANPIQLTFKYIFYRVGKNAAGDDIIEFSADTDVPFFMDRYPQYRFAVAHKASESLFSSLVLDEKARLEARKATLSLERYKKNFSGDRDMPSSQFKVAGVNLRNRRIIRRR